MDILFQDSFTFLDLITLSCHKDTKIFYSNVPTKNENEQELNVKYESEEEIYFEEYYTDEEEYLDYDDYEEDYIDLIAEEWDDTLRNKKTRGKIQNNFYQRSKKSNNYKYKKSRKNKSDSFPYERRYPQIVSYTPEYTSEYKPIEYFGSTSQATYSTNNTIYYDDDSNLQQALLASMIFSNPNTLDCGLTNQQIQDLSTRDITPEDYEMLLLLDEQIAPKTVDTKIVSKFPVHEFSEDLRDKLQDICMICLEDYEIGVKVKTIPVCSHSFHEICLDKWLLESSQCCPLDGLPIQ